jgi:hypothetical protein
LSLATTPASSSGETSSASQVFSKGHVVKVFFWFIVVALNVGFEPVRIDIYPGGNCGLQFHLDWILCGYLETSPTLSGYAPSTPHYN